MRDWSEILVIAAAIYSLRAAIIQRKKNVKTLKNANLWVFGALVVAEFRIRQLWITRTLDDEANRFKGSNEALRKEILDLTGQNTSLSAEMVPLKKQVATFGEEEERRLGEVGKKVEEELQELVAGKEASLEREKALNLREEELQKREEALD